MVRGLTQRSYYVSDSPCVAFGIDISHADFGTHDSNQLLTNRFAQSSDDSTTGVFAARLGRRKEISVGRVVLSNGGFPTERRRRGHWEAIVVNSDGGGHIQLTKVGHKIRNHRGILRNHGVLIG